MSLVLALLGSLRGALRSRTDLTLENLALRQQLPLLHRRSKRPQFGRLGNAAGTPDIDVTVPGAPGFGISPDHMKKNFPGKQWAFAVQPGTTQPFYTTTLTVVFASNTAGVTSDISGAVYCLQ